MKEEFSKIISKNTFCDEIDSKTLAYRIDGFLYACNYTLKEDAHEQVWKIFEKQYENIVNFDQNDEKKLNILVKKQIDPKRGNYIMLKGESDDLMFVFNNYYGKKKIDKKIMEIPFDIVLIKKFNDMEYQMILGTNVDKEVRFTVIKNNEKKIVFYANIFDFSKILKLVKSFVKNPDVVFNTYSEVISEKRISFTNTDVNKVIENDKNLDKPASKLMKKIKIRLNYD